MNSSNFSFIALLPSLGLTNSILNWAVFLAIILGVMFCVYKLFHYFKNKIPQNNIVWFVETIKMLSPKVIVDKVYNTEKGVIKVFYDDITTILYNVKQQQLIVSVEYLKSQEYPRKTRKDLQGKIDKLKSCTPVLADCNVEIYLYPLSVKGFINREVVNPDHLSEIIKVLKKFLAEEAYYLIMDKVQLPSRYNLNQLEKDIDLLRQEIKEMVDGSIVDSSILSSSLFISIYVKSALYNDGIEERLSNLFQQHLKIIKYNLQNIILGNGQGVMCNRS